jgi:hypothetical protein
MRLSRDMSKSPNYLDRFHVGESLTSDVVRPFIWASVRPPPNSPRESESQEQGRTQQLIAMSGFMICSDKAREERIILITNLNGNRARRLDEITHDRLAIVIRRPKMRGCDACSMKVDKEEVEQAALIIEIMSLSQSNILRALETKPEFRITLPDIGHTLWTDKITRGRTEKSLTEIFLPWLKERALAFIILDFLQFPCK